MRGAWLAGPLAATLLAAACGGDGDERSNKIFVDVPWNGPETLEYSLEQRGVDNTAGCVLVTDPAGVETTLKRICEDNRGYRDTSELTVASDTLEPKSSVRTAYDVEEDRETTYSVEYRDGEAFFEVRSGSKSRDTTRELPEPTSSSPNPGWYDDESVLWLVRGIRLAEGYEDHYTHVINAGQPRVLSVKVEVRGQETLRVPAGEFRTWEVRVSREKSVYTYWVDEGPGHRVVKARIEDSTYELTKVN